MSDFWGPPHLKSAKIMIGQISLEEAKKNQLSGFRSKKVTRGRIPAVIQGLMYMADIFQAEMIGVL